MEVVKVMKDWLRTLAIGACVLGSVGSMCFFWLPDRCHLDLEVLPGRFQKVGPIRQATKSSVDYTIYNRASVPVRIVDLVTSCVCSGVKLSKRELAPGEFVTLTWNYDTRAERGSLVIRGMIAYKREDEEQSRVLRIGLEAQIDPDYAVEPERLQFGDGWPLVQRVSVSPRHISELRIDEATCNLRFFKARVLPKDLPDRQDIEVTFQRDGYYPDAGFARLVVSTDSERQPTLSVPLDVTLENASSRGNSQKQPLE